VQARFATQITAARRVTQQDAAVRRQLAAQNILAFAAAQNYRFVTPTPLTHARVLANRTGQPASGLRDVFGWNMPFEPAALSPELIELMQQADMLAPAGDGLLRSTRRIASLDADLFLHSAFPTTQDNAVFFGPDTYRFVRFAREALAGVTRVMAPVTGKPLRVLDIGCGSGAGGIAVARALAGAGHAAQLVMNDINPLAMRYLAANAAQAGLAVELAEGDFETATSGRFDIIVSNPPYMADPMRRAYRHGGNTLGRDLSLRIASHALRRLAPGGALLLYTGVAMIADRDPFFLAMEPALAASGCDWTYEEIDPDVFGEELEQAAYSHVERIAAVGLVAQLNPIKN
jgi:methylase of polypeptide subunit release factors